MTSTGSALRASCRLAIAFLAGLALAACAPRNPSAAGAESYVHLYGIPVPSNAGERTIVIMPATRHVNIEGGEIITFVVGDKNFAWNFFVATTVNSFDLLNIAPPGVLDHSVIAYIKPDPKYMGRAP